MKFMPRLNVAVSETDRGMTMRGKRILRSSGSRVTRQLDRRSRGLGEVVPEHDAGQQVHAVVRDALADVHDLGEEEIQHPEEQQRAHERPQVAQEGPEVAQLEFGAGQGHGQLQEATGIPAKG